MIAQFQITNFKISINYIESQINYSILFTVKYILINRLIKYWGGGNFQPKNHLFTIKSTVKIFH